MLIYDPKDPQKLRELLFFSVLLLGALYLIVNAFVPNSEMILASRVLQASACVTVLTVYAGDAIRGLRSKQPTRSDFLLIGICLGFLGTLGQALYSILYRLAGAPAWMLTIETVAPTVLLSVLGAICHVAAPGAVDGELPKRNKIALGFMVGAAALGLFGLMIAQPNIADWVERAPWWMRDLFETGSIQLPWKRYG